MRYTELKKLNKRGPWFDIGTQHQQIPEFWDWEGGSLIVTSVASFLYYRN